MIRNRLENFGGFVVVACVSALVFASGCGKKDATATLKMTNTANPGTGVVWNPQPGATLAATSSAASVFGMKLIAAYLTEDIDATTQNNVGQTSMFYLNSECGDDIMHCDISAGTAEDGAPMSKVITTFFNFADTSANVNAALNAQARAITPATYKYVRMEFCKYNSGNSKNIRWGNGTVTQEFQRNQCTVNSAVMDPPITVAAGESVTVTVAYDYSTSLKTGTDATGDDCNGNIGDASRVCFTLPAFTPSASK